MRRLIMALLMTLGGALAQAQTADDPVALITDIYKTYQGDTAYPSYANPYSRRMQALIDADEKATPKGDAGTIDWDVFVNGNDWDIKNLTIALISKSAAHAQVREQFISFKPHDILFDLVREHGRWFIDDISETRVGSNRWTMSKILTHAPEAFPDEMK
jgi:hypothetical protein